MVKRAAFIDVYPDYTDWNNWHSNVIHITGEQNLPFVPDEENWREFANTLVATPTYGDFGLSSAEDYDRWQDWASDLLTAINGKPNA